MRQRATVTYLHWGDEYWTWVLTAGNKRQLATSSRQFSGLASAKRSIRRVASLLNSFPKERIVP